MPKTLKIWTSKQNISETSSTLDRAGFTLIELLVVIAIIGLLASIVLIALSSARVKSRDAKRAADLKEVSTALEVYFSDNSGYPNTNGTYTCFDCTTYVNNPITAPVAAASITAALVPAYLPTAPQDPKHTANPDSGYLYRSDGKDYMLMAFRTPENMNDFQSSVITARCGTISNGQCSGINTIGYWTPGGVGW